MSKHKVWELRKVLYQKMVTCTPKAGKPTDLERVFRKAILYRLAASEHFCAVLFRVMSILQRLEKLSIFSLEFQGPSDIFPRVGIKKCITFIYSVDRSK